MKYFKFKFNLTYSIVDYILYSLTNLQFFSEYYPSVPVVPGVVHGVPIVQTPLVVPQPVIYKPDVYDPHLNHHW